MTAHGEPGTPLPYGTQPHHGPQPQNALQPYGPQQLQRRPAPPGSPPPGYRAQPTAAQSRRGYGQPPFPGHQPPPRRGRLGLWLGIAGGGVVVILAVVIVVVAVKPGRSGTAGDPKPSSSPAAAGTLNPSACTPPPGHLAAGGGPWRLVQPATICGIPLDSALGQVAQGELSLDQVLFSPGYGATNIGKETSGVAFQAAAYGSLQLSVEVVGFNGVFNPSVAVSAFVSLDQGTFHSMPAGPHGGELECAPSSTAGNPVCIFGTSTTLGEITFVSLGQNPGSRNLGSEATAVREAVEVQG